MAHVELQDLEAYKLLRQLENANGLITQVVTALAQTRPGVEDLQKRVEEVQEIIDYQGDDPYQPSTIAMAAETLRIGNAMEQALRQAIQATAEANERCGETLKLARQWTEFVLARKREEGG